MMTKGETLYHQFAKFAATVADIGIATGLDAGDRMHSLILCFLLFTGIYPQATSRASSLTQYARPPQRVY